MSTSLHTAAIVGGVIGILALGVLVAMMGLFLRRRKAKQVEHISQYLSAPAYERNHQNGMLRIMFNIIIQYLSVPKFQMQMTKSYQGSTSIFNVKPISNRARLFQLCSFRIYEPIIRQWWNVGCQTRQCRQQSLVYQPRRIHVQTLIILGLKSLLIQNHPLMTPFPSPSNISGFFRRYVTLAPELYTMPFFCIIHLRSFLLLLHLSSMATNLPLMTYFPDGSQNLQAPVLNHLKQVSHPGSSP